MVGREARRYLKEGKLVPDEVMVQLILDEIELVEGQGWLLDGFPRTLGQVEALVQTVPVHVVLYLDVPFKNIIDRVKGRWVHLTSGRVYNDDYNPPSVAKRDDVTGESLVQRPDDLPDAVQERLKLYQQETKPVIDFFEQRGLLKTFAGTKSDIIWPKIKKYVEEKLIVCD